MEILDVTPDNVDELGFFCYMSKRKSEGFARKLEWVKARFEEGLRIKMLKLPDRGFIEYIPAEWGWRAVNADGYMLIHCLWVVGKSRKQGYAKALLSECIEDARRAGKHGVVMLTSESNWLMSRKLLVKQGFEEVVKADPSFSLMVLRFDEDAPMPSLPGEWEEKAARHPEGVTLYRTDQCPYVVDAVRTAEETAVKAGIPCKVVELASSKEVQEQSPSPFGIFGIVHDGCLLSYYYQLEKDLLPMLTGK